MTKDDHAGRPVDEFATYDHLVEEIDRLCHGVDHDEVVELSDRAALLVACGLVDPSTQYAVLARLRERMPMPTVGGFAQLRMLAEQRHEARQALDSDPGSVVRLAVRTRLMDLDRRLTAFKAGFVRGPGVFATRVKDIRVERRRGVHLDPAQRVALFDALCSTPTLGAVPVVPRTLGELGVVAARRGQHEIGRVVLPERVHEALRSLPPVPGLRTPRPHLPEMYTALLLHVGRLYDRLGAAYALGGRTLDDVRLQFDADAELVSLSRDICGLRHAAAESRVPEGRGSFSTETGLGAAVDGIWSEIVDRAVAFRELAESVELRARMIAEESRRLDEQMAGIAREQGLGTAHPGARPAAVGEMTEQLVARSGDRMLSTEAMRRLRGHLDTGH